MFDTLKEDPTVAMLTAVVPDGVKTGTATGAAEGAYELGKIVAEEMGLPKEVLAYFDTPEGRVIAVFLGSIGLHILVTHSYGKAIPGAELLAAAATYATKGETIHATEMFGKKLVALMFNPRVMQTPEKMRTVGAGLIEEKLPEREEEKVKEAVEVTPLRAVREE